MMRRRVGRPLLRTAVVGGVGYAAGRSAANSAAREADQEQRLAELEQQSAYQQQAAYSPQGAYPPQAGYQGQGAYPPQQAAYPTQASAPAPSAAGGQAEAASAPPDRMTQLKMLGDLRAAGVLTDQEFETEKQRILQQS